MFTKRDLEGETKGQWYLRQMLGSSNIDAGPSDGVHDRQSLVSD